MLEDVSQRQVNKSTDQRFNKPGTNVFSLNEKRTTMDKLTLKGNWNELKGKMKQANAELTDDDLQYEDGKDDEFLGRMQQKLGKTKDEIVDWIRSLG
jgi:uncharacterized protein YjbJ (UPF0337 family)